jgi:hypothetical protein
MPKGQKGESGPSGRPLGYDSLPIAASGEMVEFLKGTILSRWGWAVSPFRGNVVTGARRGSVILRGGPILAVPAYAARSVRGADRSKGRTAYESSGKQTKPYFGFYRPLFHDWPPFLRCDWLRHVAIGDAPAHSTEVSDITRLVSINDTLVLVRDR